MVNFNWKTGFYVCPDILRMISNSLSQVCFISVCSKNNVHLYVTFTYPFLFPLQSMSDSDHIVIDGEAVTFDPGQVDYCTFLDRQVTVVVDKLPPDVAAEVIIFR